MKTPLKKLRGFGLHKHEPKERRDIRPLSKLDELAQASLDMQDMKDCYDGLLSAAAATANSAYEFSESLREMGSCLLEKTALNDDEESGKVLLMLGKVQFDLQKHIDSYRAHIFQTITSPSESLLNELRTVEEMKRQCDEKRDVYEYMITRHREKGQSRSGKGEIFSMQQLETARDEYDEEAAFYVFRSKSLKQGQSRSLLTQAARHHAAQLCFFKKAVKSLESVEPHVKLVTEHQHIDYQFSGLNDGDEAGDDDDDDSNYDDDDDDNDDAYDDGELSFDYGQNDPERDVSTPRKSMELDHVDITFPQVATVEAVKENLGRLHNNSFAYRARPGSQSAPLFAENKFDSAEKIRQIRQSSTRKLQTYVLPTPVDMKSSISAGSGNPMLHKTQTTPSGRTRNWHSSPLDPKRLEKVLVDEKLSRPTNVNAHAVLERNNTAATRLPPPSDGLLLSHQYTLSASDSKKLKIHAFSGPLTSKPWPTKLVSVEGPHLYSGPLLQTSQLPYTSPKASPTTSPTFMSSPKISELHELPRPPASSTSKSSRPEGLAGHSAPLGSRDQVLSLINKSVVSNVASPLPRPPLIISRSFSIPSSSPSVATSYASKPLKNRHSMEIAEGVDSPPLTPIDLSRNRPSSAASETVIRVVQIRGTHMNSLVTP